jgi:hypothetical protein
MTITALPLPASAGAQDPLLAYERELLAVEAEWEAMPGDIPQGHPSLDRWREYDVAIARTPATTIEGLAVRARRLALDKLDGSVCGEELARGVLADVEALFGPAARSIAA